jgi:hypothetical protein
VPQIAQTNPRRRAIRILAKSMFRELIAAGYDSHDVVAVATELLNEVAVHMANARDNEPNQDEPGTGG